MGLFDDILPAFPPGLAPRVFGVVKVKLNGVDWKTKPGATLSVGGKQWTSQFGNGKRSGSSWQPVPSILNVEFIVSSETDFLEIANFRGIAEYITDIGLHYAADNCRTSDPPSFSDGGGGIAITIEGDEAYEA